MNDENVELLDRGIGLGGNQCVPFGVPHPFIRSAYVQRSEHDLTTVLAYAWLASTRVRNILADLFLEDKICLIDRSDLRRPKSHM